MSRQDPYAKYGGKIDPYEQYGGSTIAPAGQEERSRGASGSWNPPEKPPSPFGENPFSDKAILTGLAQNLGQLGQGVKNVARMPWDIAKTTYDAFATKPADLAPEEIPSYTMAGPGGLALHRLLVAPQTDQFKLAAEAPTKTEAFGRTLAGALPVLGPFAAHLGETIGEGRPLEAAGEAMTMGLLPKVVREAKSYAQQRPVRKGYTALNPQTLKPELPANAIQAEIGVKLPRLEPGAVVEFKEPVNLASKALGGDTSLEVGDALRRNFNEAFPDLKQAQQQNRFLRGAMDSPQKFRAAVQWARNRVWREGMEPAFKAAGEVDLSPVALQLISEIPESIRVQRPARALALENIFTEMFEGKTVKAETLHDFAKEARAKIQSKLAKNAFDRQAAFGTPDGKMAESFNTALRDRLYQHVQQKTGVDLRPTAERYGALSELEQTALGLPAPKSLLEEIFTSYTFPTPRAVVARVGERAGKHMISDMKLLEKAFDRYQLTPAEMNKVTKPFKASGSTPSARPIQPTPPPAMPPQAARQGIEPTGYFDFYTDEGLRSRFNIPESVSLRALEQRGVIQQDSRGLWQLVRPSAATPPSGGGPAALAPAQPTGPNTPQGAALAPPPKTTAAGPSVSITGGSNVTSGAYTYRPMDVSSPVAGTKVYHGTKAPIKALRDADPAQFAQENALYGPGLYLTDNPVVGAGYAKSKGRGASGKVLSDELGDVKLLDLEVQFPKEVQDVFDRIEVSYGDGPTNRSGATGKEVFKRLQEDMMDAEIPASEAVEIFQALHANLQELGFDGFRHVGGGLNKPQGPHNVVVLFPDYEGIRGHLLKSMQQSGKAISPEEPPSRKP